MKLKIIFILAFNLFAFAGNTNAELSGSSGLGIGSLYSTVGINTGVVFKNSFIYASLGCPAGSKNKNGDWDVTCGWGIGGLSTKLIPQRSNKHALGVYYGILAGEYIEDVDGNRDSSGKYRAVATYAFYFNGIKRSGWNLGISMFYIGDDFKFPLMAIPTFGYQYAY